MSGLNSSFNRVAKDYDEVRPGYPEELIEDVIEITEFPRNGRILEVGCGTGQATTQLARRGYRLLCLDIGASLLDITRKKCEGYPNVEFLNASFEEWEPGSEPFDLVVSATAFHWIRPKIGYPKAARVLRNGGHIALFWNLHPTPYSGFFDDVQEVYRRIVPEWRDPRERPGTEARIRQIKDNIEETFMFDKVTVKRYPWTRVYGRGQYLKLLDTYSDHLRLDDGRKSELYSGIGALIDEKYEGKVNRPYLSVLFIAQKKA